MLSNPPLSIKPWWAKFWKFKVITKKSRNWDYILYFWPQFLCNVILSNKKISRLREYLALKLVSIGTTQHAKMATSILLNRVQSAKKDLKKQKRLGINNLLYAVCHLWIWIYFWFRGLLKDRKIIFHYRVANKFSIFQSLPNLFICENRT